MWTNKGLSVQQTSRYYCPTVMHWGYFTFRILPNHLICSNTELATVTSKMFWILTSRLIIAKNENIQFILSEAVEAQSKWSLCVSSKKSMCNQTPVYDTGVWQPVYSFHLLMLNNDLSFWNIVDNSFKIYINLFLKYCTWVMLKGCDVSADLQFFPL